MVLLFGTDSEGLAAVGEMVKCRVGREEVPCFSRSCAFPFVTHLSRPSFLFCCTNHLNRFRCFKLCSFMAKSLQMARALVVRRHQAAPPFPLVCVTCTFKPVEIRACTNAAQVAAARGALSLLSQDHCWVVGVWRRKVRAHKKMKGFFQQYDKRIYLT